jgi:single-strand DNA-binding protein
MRVEQALFFLDFFFTYCDSLSYPFFLPLVRDTPQNLARSFSTIHCCAQFKITPSSHLIINRYFLPMHLATARDGKREVLKVSKVEMVGGKSSKPRKANATSSRESLYEPCNEVVLVGRVSAPAQLRELPSGDKVVEFRVIVDRKARRGRKREVDTLDIAAWSASARKSALTVKSDEWVEVQGSVRRRFWQAPGGLASRWQVEALSIMRL